MTPRDEEVLRMLATGNSNIEIATYLNIRPSAVKQHMRTFFLELLVSTRPPMSLLTHEPGKTGTPGFVQAETAEQKIVGLGLPCKQCRAYYPGDLTACPICKSPERISRNVIPSFPALGTTDSPTSIAWKYVAQASVQAPD
jgi:hypothetical protein